MQLDLKCENLDQLDDGAAKLIIDAALQMAFNDIEDRGKDKKKRTVTIEIEFEMRDNGQIETSLTARAKVPVWKTAATVANVRMDGKNNHKLIFSGYAPDDPDQRTLDEAGGGEAGQS